MYDYSISSLAGFLDHRARKPKALFQRLPCTYASSCHLPSVTQVHWHEILKEEPRNGHQQVHGSDGIMRKEIVLVSCGHSDEG